jgi:hypothetical protein
VGACHNILGVIGSIIYTLVVKPDLGRAGKIVKYMFFAGLVMLVLFFLFSFLVNFIV